MPAFPLSAIYLHNSSLALAAIRANVLAAIYCTITVYLIVLKPYGAYNSTIVMRAALLAAIFTVGVYLGQYLFWIAPADWFKMVTYALLICTALIMLAA